MLLIRRSLPVLLAVLALVGVMPGCKKKVPPLQQIATVAASPTGGRAAAAKLVVKEWNAKTIMLADAIMLGHDQLEAVKAGAPFGTCTWVPKSTDATAFAGAVLDGIDQLGTAVPQDDDKVLFWMQVGTLACAAAEEARASGRLPEARQLIFAGGQHWQGPGFWYMHPNYDGLAAYILAETGDRQTALQRLRDRPDLNGEAAVAFEALQKGP